MFSAFKYFKLLIPPLGNVAKILVLIVVVSCNSNNDDELQRRNISLNTENPSQSIIRLSNNGTADARFSMQVNGKLFANESELSDAVIQMKSAYKGEPLEQKAWRFVRDNVDQQRPLTELWWQHEPLVQLNSVGFGRCDDYATVLAVIWKNLGFKSRVWTLNGHAVSEVYVNDSWAMYDASYGAFYRNEEGDIASFEELANNPDLITNPKDSIVELSRLKSKINLYSRTTAGLYSTKEDNEIVEWFSTNESPYQLEFLLPPDGKLEFPYRFNDQLLTSKGKKTPSYSNLKLTLPTNWVGPVETPLVIQSIGGKGTVTIDEQSFEIGSTALQQLFDNRSSFIHKIIINKHDEPIEIVYLLNPLLMQINKENILDLSGYNTQFLDAELLEIQEPHLPRIDFDVYMLRCYDDHVTYIEQIKSVPEIDTLQISSKAEFLKKLNLCVLIREGLSNSERVEESAELVIKFEAIYRTIDDPPFFGKLFLNLNADSLFVIFISILRDEPTEFVVDLLLYYKEYVF